MSHDHPESRPTRSIGWFAIGALTATLAILVFFVAGDVFSQLGSEAQAEAQVPALIIEAK
jgi:hypothetical protein